MEPSRAHVAETAIRPPRTRCALRALDGGVLGDVLVVIACDDGNVRLRMQWHGRIIRKRSGSVVPLLNRHVLQLL